MNIPSEFYKSQIEKHSLALKNIKKQLALSSSIRLLVFLVLCAVFYFALEYSENEVAAAIIVILAAIGIFVFLVAKHDWLKYKRDITRTLINENESELQVQSRVFHHLPSGEKYKDPFHFYSQDIDLFGRGSFFQYINRTALDSGSDLLAQILTENSIENIVEKQNAVKELAQKPEWRQEFSAVAAQVKTEVPADQVSSWLKNYKKFVPKWAKPLSLAFTLISVALFVGNYFGVISGYVTVVWFFIGLAISGSYGKKTKVLADQAAKVQSTFEQFYKLVLQIENQGFSSELLVQKSKVFKSSTTKTSNILKEFARNLDALEQGQVFLFGQLVNAFMLRDLRQSHNIEQWIERHKLQVHEWFEAITFFDAFNSLGNFAFNHPHYVYPRLAQQDFVLKVIGAGHPLLNQETMVRNDFQIHSEEFFIVTGANMAGKSTFLRTVSLQIVMGNIGLPVCATSSEYNPIKLITSMRTTDSLTDDESYFFSELKRLKFIVDEIKTDKYFIILDEILKGTNSTDKAIGSRKFVEKLVGSNSTGIIATHDLSLCTAAEEMPEVKNYYFDAQIIDGELYFDYTFKPGICQNMNASFLLKKMEIVD
ncbi:DNA mismatch repair protein MutS [Aequorivita sp. H23M31]|uniref:DNA mismatch repair protein MutS n=1 Tax=Aequorivita ciconiae TaxID=2494375 RepID=A0A410G5T9_9FLAO|nr:DNA mismatch repair protein MutS [Aequorivita sp. H23M31]QAA82629.1 DNA mismatch repair protein MutS [Aequorivita sp. H23M31]